MQEKRKTILLGEYTPYRVSSRNDTAIVGFAQSAQLFTLHITTPSGKQYFDALKKAMKDDTPVKVMLYERTNEIAAVSAASKEGIERYINSKKPSH